MSLRASKTTSTDPVALANPFAMRSLYLRIYVTVVAALALFAAVTGWLVQQHLHEQRQQAELAVRERLESWAELLQRSLPPAEAPVAEQLQGLREWSQRLRLPMALDDRGGQRIAASDIFLRREAEWPDFQQRLQSVDLVDGRRLWVPRMEVMRGAPGMRSMRASPPPPPRPFWMGPRGWPDGVGLAVLLVLLFVAVAGGAYPVVRRLTRRLEALKQGVEAFGAGALHQRVAETGQDEVAAVAASFNRAASRVEALVRSNQQLLANASHELRSPLARLKMALRLQQDAPPEQRAVLQREIDTNMAELDALIEEILLAGRLDANATPPRRDPVELLAVLAEEAARVEATVEGENLTVAGDDRLLRRALRNLLENARRYGGDAVEAVLTRSVDGVAVSVLDRGPGVPAGERERIFEPFYRLPGHAERSGGVGLGLSLVRQIAQRHGGSVRCEPRAGGGTRFVLVLPAG